MVGGRSPWRAGLDLCWGRWVRGSSVGCKVAVGTPSGAGPDIDRPVGSWLCSQSPAPVYDNDAAIEPLLHFDLSAGVAVPVAIRQYLDSGTVEAHRVVVGHSADVLEAQDRIETDAWCELSISRAWLGWGDTETLVVARDEVPEHLVGLLDG